MVWQSFFEIMIVGWVNILTKKLIIMFPKVHLKSTYLHPACCWLMCCQFAKNGLETHWWFDGWFCVQKTSMATSRKSSCAVLSKQVDPESRAPPYHEEDYIWKQHLNSQVQWGWTGIEPITTLLFCPDMSSLCKSEVVAPTASGKTFIGYYVMDEAAFRRH